MNIRTLFTRYIPIILIASMLPNDRSPAVAQKSPEKIRLTPQSKNGAVLLRVDAPEVDYQLWFKKSGRSGFGSRVYSIKIGPSDGREIYIARTLEPGRYRLDSIWQQNWWGLLLSHDTVEFEVKAGSITYLGKLDTLPMLTVLQDEAVAAGKTVSKGGSGFATDRHGLRPVFTGRDNQELSNASDFAGHTMQAPDGMVELGLLHPVTSE